MKLDGFTTIKEGAHTSGDNNRYSKQVTCRNYQTFQVRIMVQGNRKSIFRQRASAKVNTSTYQSRASMIVAFDFEVEGFRIIPKPADYLA